MIERQVIVYQRDSASIFFNGGLILVIDYVRMKVTVVGASWDVVAGDQTGVDFIFGF